LILPAVLRDTGLVSEFPEWLCEQSGRESAGQLSEQLSGLLVPLLGRLLSGLLAGQSEGESCQLLSLRLPERLAEFLSG
jgi:hypothetical protein